jgi:hypothetical protein
VVDVNIHFPFYIGAAAIVLGIGTLATGHRLLGEAERVQAEAVRGAADEPRMDESASAELRRHAEGRVLVVDPGARVS